jgi:hypothetical protein
MALLYLADPVLHINEVFNLGFNLDENQARIVISQAKRLIVCCTRQWGKTTTVAAKAAAEALADKGLILVVAPVERQARECFRKIRDCLKLALPDIDWPEDNKTSLELPNGARIVALPAKGDNIRGYTNPRLIIIDEAAFVPDLDYKAIRPMLSHGARLIVMSTPFGKRGWFYERWIKAPNNEDGWERIHVAAADCPHIPLDFLEEERAELGPAWYSQEYEIAFLDSIVSFFDMDAVRASLEEGITPFDWLRADGTVSSYESDAVPMAYGWEREA